jgi:hypothetical protein
MIQARLFSPPNQFVGDATKIGKTWQQENIDYFESLILIDGGNTSIKTSYYNKLTNYNLKRGYLNMADVEVICDPMQLGMGTFPGKLEHKGLGNAKIDLLVGEHIKRKFDFRVIRSSSDQQGIKEVEEQKTKKIYDELLQHIQSEKLDEQELTDKINKLNEFVKSPYFDIAERGANKILKYTYKRYNIKDIFDACFEDALISSEQYIFTEYLGGELVVRRGDPLRIFSIMNQYDNTEEGLESLVEISYHTLSSLIDMFHDELTEAQIEKLRELRGETGSSPYLTYPKQGSIGELAIPTDSLTGQLQSIMPIGTGMQSSMFTSFFNSRGNYRLMTTYWKSKRKIKIVGYLDEYGVEQEKVCHQKYTIDDSLGEFLVKEEWINEWWKGYKIAGDIYVGCKPVEFLGTSIDNISKQTAPITIQYYNTGSMKAQSLMDILKPYDYLYDIFDYRRQILVNLMLPDIITFNTTMIPDGMSLHEYLNMAMSTAFMPQDPTAEIITPKGNQAAGVFNTVTSQRLSATQQGPIGMLTTVMNDVKQTMDIVSGITQQRQGEISSNESVGGVERSVTQSSHSTERWFNTNEQFKQRALKKILDIQLNVLRKNPKKLNYLLDDFTKAVITDDEIDAIQLADFDVLVSRSTDDSRLLQVFETMFQAAMQNGKANLSDLMDVYKNESIGDGLRILRNRELERTKQEQAMAQQGNKLAEMESQKKYDLESRKLDLEQQKIDQGYYKIDQDNKTKIAIEQMAALAFDEGDDSLDIVDTGETALKQQELLMKQNAELGKHARETQKMNQDRVLKEKEITTKKETEELKAKVARENMKNDLQITRIQARNKPKAK